MLHIWGRISSINVRKVVWTAQELGLDLQRTDAGGQFSLVRQPDYLRKNPNALVPMIEDDGLVLWESNVIVRYLCAKYDTTGKLYPQDLPQRFTAEQWMDWQQTTFNPAARGVFMQLFRTPVEQRQPELIAQSVANTEPLLDILDAHLARHAHIGGEQFSMADIPLACGLHRWFAVPQPPSSRPNLQRWYQTILARPTTRGVLDIELS